MDLLILLLAICAFVVIYNLVGLLTLDDDREHMTKRLSTMFKKETVEDARDDVLKEKKDKKKKRFGLHFISDKFEDELMAAGIQISGDEFLKLWLLVALVPALFIVLLSQNVITALALMALGLAIPPFLVEHQKKKRAALFNRQLGDALMIISNSIRAGYTFLQALESLAKENKPPLSDEFKIVLREIDIGVPMEDALKHLVNRTGSDDVKILVSAVLISSQVGANLSEVLETIAATIRSRLEMKEQVRALTAQGRISGLVVGLLPIALLLLLMIMNPTYILGFVQSTIGIVLLILGAIMEVIGFIIINRIVDLKY